jgi:hypothetical protein
MKFKDVINESVYCSIGCITKPEDIETLERYLLYNKEVISKFPKIIVALTKTDNISFNDMVSYVNVFPKIFGEDKCFVDVRPNRGHTFGFTDLDKTVLKKAKELGFKWAFKSTNDVLLTETVFELELEDSEFFFLQGHGYTGMNSYYKLNVDLAVDSFKDNGYEYFFPQTNFFIIKLDIDCLCDDVWFDEIYNKCVNDPDYSRNKTQTEYKYLLCEIVLRDCVIRNKLKCKHLIGKESYKKLLHIIVLSGISDSSHKNIFFNDCGVCHFHFADQPVIEI